MAAARDFEGGRTAGAWTMPSELAKRHLVQPWPFAGSIGAEARAPDRQGDGIYITDGDWQAG